MSTTDSLKLVLTQTNYSEEEAKEKLAFFQNDPIKVIREYMGLEVVVAAAPQNKKVVSVNQEIFRQFRRVLDSSLEEYREKHPINIEQVIDNIQQSEEALQKQKK